MESYLPNWLQDFETILSIVGFIITAFLLFEVKKIRSSFLRRARIPEMIDELKSTSQIMSKNINNWNKQKRSFIEQALIAKGILENLKEKLVNSEKKKVNIFLSKLKPKKLLIISISLNHLTEDEAWEMYAEFSALITSLVQHDKPF